MANLTLQLTIPASGVANLSAALPVLTGGQGQSPQQWQPNLMIQWLQFQNNAAHNCRYGTSPKVSVTVPAAVNGGTAGFGILLFANGGAGSQSTPVEYATMISDWWVAGTPGDVIDVLALQ